jgi:hypothetical protein
LRGIGLPNAPCQEKKTEKSTGLKQMYKLWVMIYENFKYVWKVKKYNFVYNKCPYL